MAATADCSATVPHQRAASGFGTVAATDFERASQTCLLAVSLSAVLVVANSGPVIELSTTEDEAHQTNCQNNPSFARRTRQLARVLSKFVEQQLAALPSSDCPDLASKQTK